MDGGREGIVSAVAPQVNVRLMSRLLQPVRTRTSEEQLVRKSAELLAHGKSCILTVVGVASIGQ